MNRYFDYRILLDDKKPEHKSSYGMVIFIPPIEFNEFEFESYVSQIPWKKRLIDKLYLLIPDTSFKEISDQFINDHITERLPIHFRKTIDEYVVFIKYNEVGELMINQGLGFRQLDKPLSENIIQSGLLKIFKDGNGILEYSHTHHYILQSGKHSDKFIRTANVLEHGSRVDFIAFSLLKFIKPSIKAIYCDTSSISALAYSVIKLKLALANKKSKKTLPYVDSFKSYDGLDDKKFSFIHKDECVVLISASTSGELCNGLVEKIGISANNIITIFYLNSQKITKGKILCNLSSNQEYKDFYIALENKCKLCKDQSVPIKITGEQFIPEEVIISEIEFDLRNLPTWFRLFISQFHSKKIISCYYGKSSESTREIYLNLELILKTIKDEFLKNETEKTLFKEFQKKLRKKIEHVIPISTNRIIHMADASSILLSNLILDFLHTEYGIKKTAIQLVNYNDFGNNQEGFKKNKGTTIVVASSIATGRKLLTISLLLRNDKSSIIYFIGISRTKDREASEKIEKYIGFDNSFGAKTNPFHFLESIHIPDDTNDYTYNTAEKRKNSSWMDETELLITILEFIKRSTKFKKIKAVFNNRLLELNNAKSSNNSEKGLVNNLFWNSSNNELLPLELRDNFAFFKNVTYDKNKVKEISQADVYFTIAAIFHQLRMENKMSQSEHHRSLISPKNFHCYNDGIIQAAILRASYPEELDYRVQGKNMNLVNDIKRVIQPIFRNWNRPIGEATFEFLICIAMKRLKIPTNILTELINELKIQAKESLLITCLCDYILENNN